MRERRRCYISFKTKDKSYRDDIQSWIEENKVDVIGKSLKEPIDSDSEDHLMRRIRKEYLSDSTVTIFLIGENSSERFDGEGQKFIKQELRASLYSGADNARNGILGVVLPEMYRTIFLGEYQCPKCKGYHMIVVVDDTTVIREFGRNYFLNEPGQCSCKEEDRYCVLVRWDVFKKNPNKYIELAFEKRNQPVAKRVVVKPE